MKLFVDCISFNGYMVYAQGSNYKTRCLSPLLVGPVRWQHTSGAVDGIGVDNRKGFLFRRNFFPIIYYEQVVWNRRMVAF